MNEASTYSALFSILAIYFSHTLEFAMARVLYLDSTETTCEIFKA